MSYYWFNRQELLQKTKEKYQNNKNVLKENARHKYKNLLEEEKEPKRQ